MPDKLPPILFIKLFIARSLSFTLLMARAALVGFVWLACLPYSIVRITRFCFFASGSVAAFLNRGSPIADGLSVVDSTVSVAEAANSSIVVLHEAVPRVILHFKSFKSTFEFR